MKEQYLPQRHESSHEFDRSRSLTAGFLDAFSSEPVEEFTTSGIPHSRAFLSSSRKDAPPW